MAGTIFLLQEQARAERAAIESVARLLQEPSERLAAAQYDASGKVSQPFVHSMLLAELARVVERQDQELSVLAAEVKRLRLALENTLPRPVAKSSSQRREGGF